jgi:antirestriction protein ArdC
MTTATHVFTPETATSFDGYSPMNATILDSAAADKGCDCKPYLDWFTYKRWAAQGFQVQKGEKGTKISTFIKIEKDEGKFKSFPKQSSVFCRCQVKPIEEK